MFSAACWEGKVAFFSQPQIQNGKKFITVTRVKSQSHRRDVTCIDTTFKSHIVTGSIDNVICFWQSFSATENKVIRIPSHLADPKRSQITNLKFVDPESNEFLIVFMSDGTVFVIETLDESFMPNKEGQFELAVLAKISRIDVQNSYVLSVGEKGK